MDVFFAGIIAICVGSAMLVWAVKNYFDDAEFNA